MNTYKSFPTYSCNQRHENNFVKYFLGSYLKDFPTVSKVSTRMMTSGLNNGLSKTGVGNIFVFDIRQKSKRHLFEDL